MIEFPFELTLLNTHNLLCLLGLLVLVYPMDVNASDIYNTTANSCLHLSM